MNTEIQSKISFRQKVTVGWCYGLAAGTALAVAEVMWTGLTSSHPPMIFLVYAALGDVILMGAVGGVIGAITGLKKDGRVSPVLFGSAMVLVYVLNGICRSSFPGLEGSLSRRIAAAIFFVCVCSTAGWVGQKRELAAVEKPTDLFYSIYMLVVSIGIVGVIHINKRFLPDLFTVVSIAVNFILAVSGLLLVLLAFWLSRRDKPPSTGGNDLGRLLLAFSLVAAFLVAFWNPVARWREKPLSLDKTGERHKTDSGVPVILITVDTLRADHVSVYGYSRPTTPNIDRLADDSVVFRHTVSPSSWTLPAHASLFTGLLPSEHGADFVPYGQEGINREMTDRVSYKVPAVPLAQSALTLAEVLQENGYVCGAIIGNCAYLWRGFQLYQGFHYYDDARGVSIPVRPIFDLRRIMFLREMFQHKLMPYRNAETVTDRSIEWLEDNDGSRSFLFINYMDPHTPYAAPPKFRSMFSTKSEGMSTLPRDIETAVMKNEAPLPDEARRVVAAKYDAEVRYMDAEVGRLLDWLKKKNLYDKSMIVFSSDHGESFGEHSYLYHMNSLYEHEIWVPLIIKLPHSQRAGENVGETMALADVPNWILQEIDLPALTLDPPLIAELFANEDRVQRFGSRYNRNLKAIYANGLKYIFSSTGEREIYNLANDPSESDSDMDPLSEETKEVAEELDKWVAEAEKNSLKQTGEATSGKDIVENLKALGYLN